MLRNPVEMVYALNSEYLYHRIEDISDFGRALAAEKERREGRRLPHGELYPRQIYFYRDVATFSPQVERYLSAFGPEKVHVILFDDLKRDAAAVYGRLLEFLGVDSSFRPELKVVNPNKRLRSWRLHAFLGEPPGLSRRLVRRAFPFAAARERVARAANKWNLAYAPRPPMDPVLRRSLSLEFGPEVRRLTGLLGRDLDHWLEE
jgi:hypothetical protein